MKKSEILFLYESAYSTPNGDPFTGEQRYDDETKQILVSDVRIKRFIRDYLALFGHEIYVVSDTSLAVAKESGSAARMKSLKAKYKDTKAALDILKKCIDVRMFGGISTEEKDNANITGAVQFALLNPSLNEVDLRIHQTTSVFVSSVEKKQGAIGTTTVVPYSLNQIHGWINPFSAEQTGLTEADVQILFSALWESINNANSRSKSNQNSMLLLNIVYTEPNKKIYRAEKLIKMNPKDNKRSEQVRHFEDYDFDFSKLYEAINADIVEEVQYYTEIPALENKLIAGQSKFTKMTLENISKVIQIP